MTDAVDTGGAPEDARSAAQVARTLLGALWFPALFFVGFLLCYLLPFHSPQPHDVRVAVADPAVAARIEAGLDRAAPGAFDVVPVRNAAEAKAKVLDRDVVAGFSPGRDTATLYYAKANGLLLDETVQEAFTAVAQQSRATLKPVDLAPTEHGDVMANSLFYLVMVWNVVPYIGVMMLVRAFSLGRRILLTTVVGGGAVLSVLGYLFGLALDVIPNQPLAMVYAFLLTQAVGWTVFGLVPFVRQFIPGVAITLFVLLSIPSSGGAIPYQMVPGFFRWLHPTTPLGNTVDALRGVFYFDGKGLLRPTLVLCAWLLAGMLLTGLSVVLRRRKELASDQAEGRAGDVIEQNDAYDVEDPSIEVPLPHGVRAGRGGEPAMLQGTVTRTDGAPVAGAVVTVLDGHGRQLARTTTDRHGDYGVTPLPEEHLTLLLSASGWTPAVVRVFPHAGRVLRHDFTLAPRYAATAASLRG